MRLPAVVLVLLLAAAGLTGCGWFGDDDTEGTSVFDTEPGMCFHALTEVEAQVDDLDQVDCTQAHALEAYAVVSYDKDGDTFPGADDLAAFADGHCAREFRGYVGIDYLDSDLFFTYLLPSPRSWEENDREVLCLVTTAGEPLNASVKGSER
jgi:Septum formation